MMELPLVSIVVPVYNVEKYLEQCIHSLLCQDYQNLEIIAVNDGSTDASLAMLQSFALRDFRLKIIDKPNGGVSEARNIALQNVQGEYVMFVDADDWLDSITVSACIRSIQNSQSDVCLFTYTREFNNVSTPKTLFESDRIFDVNECRQLHRRMIGPINEELGTPGMLDSFGTIWGKVYHKNIICQTKFIDLKIIGTAEDTLFNCCVFRNVRKAVYVNQPFYHYRKFNSGSETKKYKANLCQQWIKLYGYMSHVALSAECQEALSNRIALNMFGLGLNECMSHKNFLQKKKQIQIILNLQPFRNAYEKLNFSYFPPHWKIYFLSAKYKAYGFFLLLTEMMHFLINRKN